MTFGSALIQAPDPTGPIYGCTTDTFTRTQSGWEGGPLPWVFRFDSGGVVAGCDGSRAFITSTTSAPGTGFAVCDRSMGYEADMGVPLEFAGVVEMQHGPDIGGGRIGGSNNIQIEFLAATPDGEFVDLGVIFQRFGADSGPGFPQKAATFVFGMISPDDGFSDLIEDGTAGKDDYPSAWGTTQIPLGFRFRIEQTQLLAKLWDASGAEPGAWDVTYTFLHPILIGQANIGSLLIWRLRASELQSTWLDDFMVCFNALS